MYINLLASVFRSLLLFYVINFQLQLPTDPQELPAAYSEIIKTAIEVRTPDLKNELIEKSHAVSPSYLRSFDWKLKVNFYTFK